MLVSINIISKNNKNNKTAAAALGKDRIHLTKYLPPKVLLLIYLYT